MGNTLWGRTMKRAVCLAIAAGIAGTSTATLAQNKVKTRQPACSEIMAMCMKRAGRTHAGICEDMFHHAKHNGYWQATVEPNGKKHPEVPCTP